MHLKKICLNELVGKGVKLKSVEGSAYGTIFQETPASFLEFIYRINNKSIGSILLNEKKINCQIKDNQIFIKNRCRLFCHGKLTPFICNFSDYEKRNNFLLSLEYPVGEDYILEN